MVFFQLSLLYILIYTLIHQVILLLQSGLVNYMEYVVDLKKFDLELLLVFSRAKESRFYEVKKKIANDMKF